MVDDGMMSLDETAAYFKVSRWTIYRWIKSGALVVIRRGRVVRVPRAACMRTAIDALSRPIAKVVCVIETGAVSEDVTTDGRRSSSP